MFQAASVFFIFSAPLGRYVLTLLLISYLRNSAQIELQACYRASGTEIGLKRNVETSPQPRRGRKSVCLRFCRAADLILYSTMSSRPASHTDTKTEKVRVPPDLHR